MIKQSEKTKNKQNMFYYTGLAVVSLLLVLITYMMLPKTQQKKPVTLQKKIDMPTDSMNPQELLNDKLEGEQQLMRTRFKNLEGFLLDTKAKEELAHKENLKLRTEMENLKRLVNEKENLKSLEQKLFHPKEKSTSVSPFSDQSSLGEHSPSLGEAYVPRRGLVIDVVQVEKNLVKHVDTTIPAGTTVRAVLVSSVDAPCGAYSSSDPQPVKLRILDDGHLPKKVRAKLKGGIVIASAHGDLSSERLYIRVERLTQVKPSGDFVETAITGFITGEDGKYGVRGVVVDKSAKLVKNAAISGAFSGINSLFQAYASQRWNNNCCGFGGVGGDYSNKDLAYGLAAQGGASGMQNALNTLTDYYIKRAEFIKPVLQVNAGRIVDLTFSLSTDIGDIHSKDKTEKIRNESRSKDKREKLRNKPGENRW